MIPVTNFDFTQSEMNIVYIHPRVIWNDIFYLPVPINFMKPEQGKILLSNLVESRLVQSVSTDPVMDDINGKERLLIIKKNLLRDYLEENTVMASLQSFLHYFNKKVKYFEFSFKYHESHQMGDQIYTNGICLPTPKHLPFSEDNFLEVPLEKETYENIWEVCHGEKPENTSEYILRFPFCSINCLLVQL